MRIGMIFNSLNAPGGSASVFLSLASALQKKGHEVSIFCYYFDPKHCFPELTKNLTIYSIKKIQDEDKRINNNSLFNRLLLGVDYYVNARKIFSLMKDKKLDVIYASEACAYIPALAYKAKHGTKVFWSVFDPLSLVDNKRPGLITHRYRWFSLILRLHNIIDKRNISRIDRVIVPTKKMKKQLDSFYGINCLVLPTAGVRKEESEKSRETVAMRRIKKLFSFDPTHQPFLFSNGHLLPHRRYEDAITALVRLSRQDLFYIISGSDKFDPEYYQKLKEMVARLELEKHVFFDTEFKTNDELIGYYELASIFLFVSVEQTWGLAPFEAMLYKKPVIISEGVGCSEVLQNNYDAIIVKEKSPLEIKKAIESLLSHPQKRKEIATNGYKTTIQKFTYSSIADSVIKVLS